MQRFIPASVNFAGAIIDKFGGTQQLSAWSNIPYTTIEGWRRSGVIPDKYRPGLLALAREHGIPHTPWDYIAHLVDLPIAA